MTFEQETKEISDFLRMNSGCFSPSGILTNAAERLDEQAAQIEAFKDEMRELASWLGAGGYNSTDVTPKVFAEKIRWGVDHIVRVESKRRDDVIEQQVAEIAILSQKNPNGDRNPSPGDPCGRSCEGQAYRIELRQALAKIEQQAKEIKRLTALLIQCSGKYSDDVVTGQ